MAVIWKSTDDGYESQPLQEVSILPTNAGGPKIHIVPFRDGTSREYVMIAPGGAPIRVNGTPTIGGLSVLKHKDEWTIGDERFYFSAESTPMVELHRHDSSGRNARCPICRGEIGDGQATVRCPSCSRIYHQIAATDDSPEKPCWTYTTDCRFCGHPTSLSGEPSWRPEQEETVPTRQAPTRQ